MHLQFPAAGNILWVHVIPSGEVAAMVEAPVVTAVKTPLPNAIAYQLAETGSVLAAQARPLDVAEAIVPTVLETATTISLP
jgi:hypothetical protein